MRVVQLASFTDNYIFILEKPQSLSMMAVDPGDPDVVLKYARKHQKQLTDILVTHHHWDHTDGVEKLIKEFQNCRVWTPSQDPKRFPWSTDVAEPGKVIRIGGVDWTILALPGHTYDHIGYWDPKEKRLFSGDTIFNIGCGRIFDGSLETLYESLLKIKSLPSDTAIYCAHEYTLANIEFAKQHLPELDLARYEKQMSQLRAEGKPTVPFQLSSNLTINPFLTASNVAIFASRRMAKDQA